MENNMAKSKSKKVTPAMVKWCEFLKRGGRIDKWSVVSYFCCGQCGFTYVMGNKLEDAGLVYVDSDQRLRLTPKGLNLLDGRTKNQGFKRDVVNECYHCTHKRNVSGDAHVTCVNPDPKMRGDQYGISHSWFNYPTLFDPVWKTKLCDNFELKEK
jgi:hypothetical protein